MVTLSRKKDSCIGIATAALILAVASGNAIAMIAISVTALVLLVVLNREELKQEEYRTGVFVTVLIAAAIGIGTVFAVTKILPSGFLD